MTSGWVWAVCSVSCGLGTISTVYKSHGAMLDPIYRTAQQQRDRGLQSDLHSGAGEDGQGRANNTIRYDSPTWNGLGIGAHYTLQNDTAENSTDSPWGTWWPVEQRSVPGFCGLHYQ